MEGDEGAIRDEEGDGGKRLGEGGGRKVACVAAFHDHDARVLAELPGQLAAADVDGEDAGGSVLEEAVGEAAGGRAEVDGGEAGGVDVESLESVFQLVTAAADEAFGGVEADGVLGAEAASGFIGGVSVDANGAGEDEALGFFPGLAESEVDEGLVESLGPGLGWGVDGGVRGRG